MVKVDILVFSKRNKSAEVNIRFSTWQEGDICKCIKVFLPNDKISLFKIKNIRNEDEYWWWCDEYEEERFLYIHDWFYTISEWRDSQINILNEE